MSEKIIAYSSKAGVPTSPASPLTWERVRRVLDGHMEVEARVDPGYLYRCDECSCMCHSPELLDRWVCSGCHNPPES